MKIELALSFSLGAGVYSAGEIDKDMRQLEPLHKSGMTMKEHDQIVEAAQNIPMRGAYDVLMDLYWSNQFSFNKIRSFGIEQAEFMRQPLPKAFYGGSGIQKGKSLALELMKNLRMNQDGFLVADPVAT